MYARVTYDSATNLAFSDNPKNVNKKKESKFQTTSASKIMSSKDCLATTGKNMDFVYTYRCRICRKSFRKFMIFEGHFAFNAKCRAKGGLFMQCYICGERFRHLAVLKYHLRRHKTNKNNDFHRTGSQIVDRTKINPSRGSYSGLSCNICQRNFRTRIYLLEHMVSHSRNGITRNKGINAVTSSIEVGKSKTFPNQNSKTDNINKRTTDNQNTYSGSKCCKSCKLSFTTEVSLKFHQKLFHSAVTTSEPKANQRLQYKCEICQATFSFSNNLTKHRQVHSAGDVECHICSIRFTKQSLKVHTKEAHPEITADDLFEDVPQKGKRHEQRNISKNDEQTADGENLEVTNERPDKNHQCKICKQNFSAEYNLLAHVSVHKGDLKCKLCKISFTQNALRKHMTLVHSERNKSDERPAEKKKNFHECNLCKKSFNRPSHLAHHLLIHKGDRACEICRIPFTKKALEAHINRFHPDKSDRFTKKTCNICKQSFKWHSELARHKLIHNGNQKCEKCNIPFTNAALLAHKRRYHAQPHQPHQCKICKKRFRWRNTLMQHATVHNGRFECAICQIPFTKNALLAHRIRHHADKRPSDVIAKMTGRNISHQPIDKENEQRRANERNISSANESQLECKICKRKFNHQQNLKQHETIHKSRFNCKFCKVPYLLRRLGWHEKQCSQSFRVKKMDLKFKCTVCKKVCNSASNLGQHERVHTIGEHKCEYCQISFTKVTLLSHQKLCGRKTKIIDTTEPDVTEVDEISTSKISFNCPIDRCDKRFSLNHGLRMHLKSHSNRTAHEQNPQSFECYVCKDSVPSTKALRTHLKKHIVYEQWIDPINVYLSNWCPEKSREILQNQPLVLVENLNINNMSLSLIGLNGRNGIEVGTVDNDSNFTPIAERNSIEMMKVENGVNVRPFTNGEMSTVTDECVTIDRISIELKPPINDDSEKEQPIPVNRVADLALASDSEDISAAEQQPDTTTVFDDDDDEKVIDVSSESDVDDILELFHCYFCDETFRSLEALGVHVKTCSFCP